jgi:hypothetical protein
MPFPAVRPGPLGHNRCRRPARRASRDIHRKAHRELMTQRLQREDGRVFDDLEQRQDKIAGNAE